MEFLFNLWDADGSGSVELWELSDALEDARDDMEEVCEYLLEQVKGLATSSDGTTDEVHIFVASRPMHSQHWLGISEPAC